MGFCFVIPAVYSDLLNSNGNNYFVKRVYDAKDLTDLLKAARTSFAATGPFYIFDHFDTFYSLRERAKQDRDVSLPLLIKAIDLLFNTIDKMGQMLTTFLQRNEEAERNSYLNLLKMVLFIKIELIEAIDKKVMQPDSPGSKKTNKKGSYGNEMHFEWDDKRYRSITQIYNVLQLPIENLWHTSIPEESFVNTCCELGYRTLETQWIKQKRVESTVFQIFGTAIKRYNHALTFPVRILQILRLHDMATVPIANGICLLNDDFGISTISAVLLKDLVETLQQVNGDVQISKHFSNFLTELGSVGSKLLVPHLSKLAEDLLNVESHVVRICVLQLMGDVVTVEMASEELSEELKESRDEYLEDLLNHVMDVSAHVRSKVLQIFTHMKSENAVPLAWHQRIFQAAADRLEDRTNTVRKSAVLLIKAFLETNPFSSKLSQQELKEKYDKETEKFLELREKMVEMSKKRTDIEDGWDELSLILMPIIEEVLSQGTQVEYSDQNIENHVQRVNDFINEKKYREAICLLKIADAKAGNASERMELPFEQQCGYYLALINSYLFLPIDDFTQAYTLQDQVMKFLEDTLAFTNTVAHVLPKIQTFLFSKTQSDVFEAIDFFTTAYLFGIENTEAGMMKMLALVWSGETEKKEAVAKAFNRVLFVTDQQGRAHSVKVVDNLCAFLSKIDAGQVEAFSVLMKEWIDMGQIDAAIITVLFERFTKKLENTTESQAQLCLLILVMASSGKSQIAKSNVDTIQMIGFGERGLRDPRYYSACLKFLMNTIEENSSKYYKRHDMDHAMITEATDVFKKIFFFPKVDNFDDVGSSFFKFIYKMSQQPDSVSQGILMDLSQKVLQISDKIKSTDAESQNNAALRVPIFILTRIIFCYGLVVMNEVSFLDIDVYNNMKYRQELMEEKKSQNNKNKSKRSSNLNTSARDALKRLSDSAAEPQQEPDEMLIGASAEDSIAELITSVCEDELLYSTHGMLKKFVPVIIEILKHPGKYTDNELQQAACLSMIRFMSASSKFCSANLQFLMNILIQTKNIKVKCNIIIGLSDFTFRFPNVIAPWINQFYSTLNEENDELRLTAVKVLSYLILHEMIRVKGQISALAMCIVDPNDEIRNSTQQFFREIAHKSNILYNVLPDIISRLSDPNSDVEEEKYRVIMKYIIGLINKDKQVESLVEKLCLRFKVTKEERQWRDIGYCLSLLSYTEKTIKKLIENIPCFKDKVQIDEVYECFKSIISNTLKFARPEVKAITTEFQKRLEDCLAVNDGERQGSIDDDEREAMPPPKTIPGRRGKKVPPKKKSTNTADADSDEDDDSTPRRGRAAVRRGVKPSSQNKAQVASDSDEDDEDDENERPRKRNRRNRK
ncbi:Condensin complex subunit 1 [Pseudolycoriella hygida]|uniref:Condensin complex subunit 1 n=1 Tax=Pseudolycoriella hygida TaxID=35572 RepID=A0A9Q0N6T1_9DIPT|nr:Condensin complex subunit 1 [Pseudolycoriella hygida]